MQTFTYAISQYLLKKHVNLKDVTLVFPGRRAGLFLLKELSAQSKNALFAPKIITLDQLASDLTGIMQGDTLPMLYSLYDVYRDKTGSVKSFDDFIFHGNTLLSDFNECDNELIDIEKLYANISDIKDVDEQYSDNIIYAKEFILGFWQMFIDNRHLGFQEGFGKLWEKLPLIYREFSSEMAVKGIGYGGHIMRMAAEEKKYTANYIEEKKPEHLYFAGFNALTRAEKAVFDNFRKTGIASFLWDHDEFYLKNIEQEAGNFMRENIKNFPMPKDFTAAFPGLFDNYRKKKKIRIIPAPQVTDQARYLEELAAQGHLTEETAIVLADEKMLIPVIHALPSGLSANVTMGYEIRYTASFALLDSILSLYRNSRTGKNGRFFRSADASKLLMHYFFRDYSIDVRKLHRDLLANRTYIKDSEIEINGLLKNIFTFDGIPSEIPGFLTELFENVYSVVEAQNNMSSRRTEMQAIFEIYNQIKKLRKIISEHITVINNFSTVASLIKRAVSMVSISYKGEPLTGLQIMGFLETRAVDFKNVVILSANEGILPKTSPAGSFIPMALRKGFRMRTPSYDEAIFAYNFYRLIQRAENVWITWCTGQGITEKAEMSRYLLQMSFDRTHETETVSIDNRPVVSNRYPIIIEKDNKIISKLSEFLTGKKKMSSSSVNSYIDCPLRFYFNYIAGMKEYDEAIEEDMDNRIIGSLFHKAAELLYNSKLKENEIVSDTLLRSFNESDYNNAISGAFTEVLKYRDRNYSEFLSGTEWLYDEIIRKYLKALVEWDIKNCPFVYMGHELSEEAKFGGDGITFYSRIDRIDEKDGELIISDYKASNLNDVKVTAEKAFDEKAKKRNYVFQMYFYRYIVSQNYKKPVQTRLIAVNKLVSADSCAVGNDLAADDMNVFKEKLNEKLNELFSPEIPFVQAADVDACRYCNYTAICNRQEPKEF